jgi:O-acetyl-ADP-ribose deacetylase (regulator of RNase III)
MTERRSMFRSLAGRIRRMRSKTLKPFGRCAANFVRVSLTDRNPTVAQALAARFDGVNNVEVLEGDLLDLDCDALVSPANSFGFMDGGIDQAIDRFFGGAAQRAVLDRIADRFYGELPVGSATIIAMPSVRFPFLVVAPTMRVPGDSRSTINAYLAMRAALIAILDHNQGGSARIGSIGVPGLCTGVGSMLADESATQMRAAYDMIFAGGWQAIVHPLQAPFALAPAVPPERSG